MSELSVFPDKTSEPTENDVKEVLVANYDLWKRIYDIVFAKYPDGIAAQHFPRDVCRGRARSPIICAE